MSNTYFHNMDVGSAQEASILSNEYTWTILELLHKTGTLGLPALEVHKKVEKKEGSVVSKSKVYDLLKRLYELEWLHKTYDSEIKSHRYTLAIQWGDVDLDEKFYDTITNKMKKQIQKELFPIIDKYLQCTIDNVANDKKSKKWLPGSGDTWICKKCHANHEAEEFITALLEIVNIEYVNSDNHKKFLMKNRFATGEYE